MQFLYFIEVSKRYNEKIFEGIDITTNGDFDYDKINEIVYKLTGKMKKSINKGKDDKAVDKWYLEESKRVDEFQFNLYKNYLMENSDINEFFSRFNIEVFWSDLRRRLINFAHNNGVYYTDANNTSYYAYELSKRLLEQISKDIADIMSYFLVLLIILKPESISSSDMLDYLEAGIEPPEDCQYWVIPVIQEYLDKYVSAINSGIKDFLKDLSFMQIK